MPPCWFCQEEGEYKAGLPFSVSSEDPTDLKSPYDHKTDEEVKGVDLNVLFEGSSVSIVNDYVIILVWASSLVNSLCNLTYESRFLEYKRPERSFQAHSSWDIS